MRLIDADRAKSRAIEVNSIAPWSLRSVLLLLDAAPTIEPPPNAPLTLAELREMVGEPVCIYSDLAKTYKWRVISSVGEWLVRFTDGANYGTKDCGKTWLAYRRKPEEGGDAI